MRIAALLCTAALLGGCNMITSERPLFSAADAAGQPQLRPGVWIGEKPDCQIDEAKPRDQWPDCIDSWVVRPNEVVAARDKGKPPGAGDRYPIVLAKGDPAVLQIGLTNDAGAIGGYVYAGLKPLKRDERGRIIEYKLWPALCGPPPKADPNDQGDGMVTSHPLDGLVIDKKNHDCVATDPAPVRVSARLSEAWNDADGGSADDGRARWVRDGER